LAEKTPQEQLRELKELLIAYFKQETIDPIKGLLRYVGFGLLGALLMGTGIFFVAMGLLRALQTQTGTALTGNWSWVPYVITVAGLLGVAFVAFLRARSGESSQ
jgi:membrane protein implicated in regulation of membrane protease activity